MTTIGSGRNIAWLLDVRAREIPQQIFFTWEPFTGPACAWTYAEFAHSVACVAGGLSQRGIKSGDFVLIHLDNCAEYLLTLFACARIGAVAVCTNVRSTLDELSYYAQHSGAVAAITQPGYADLVANAMPAAKPLWITADDNTLPAREQAFDELLKAPPLAAQPVHHLAPAIVQYTSGTTGRPKAVVLTHANALWGARVNAAHEGLTAADVLLVYLPLFHINAQAYSVLSTLWAGARFVLQPRFSASRFWDVSLRHRCTFASQIYFALRALDNIEAPAQHFYRLWGTGICGHPIAAKFGIPTLGWWGMTETISHPIVGELGVPNTPATIGRAAPEYEIAVVRDDGSPVEAGETGALLVRGVPGVSLFAGYLHDAEATAAAFDENGWFRSGDRITVHADGSLSFADRSKDMLKVGAENVAASEIERVVASIPGVVEVAAIGRPDPMLDEVPVVFVVAKNPHAELEALILSTCRARLADFKVPRAVHFIDEFPRATLEKVAKHKLRALLKDSG